MSTQKLDNLKHVIQMIISDSIIDAKLIKTILEIPAEIFDNSSINLTLQKIADLLDVNGDGKYTVEDFEILGEELKKGDVNLYVHILSTLFGLVYNFSRLSKMKLSTDEIINISIKLVLYGILIPIMKCQDVSAWAKQINSKGKTNLDSLFVLLEAIYMFLITAESVKNITECIIKFISTRCNCCCKGSTQDKTDVLTEKNITNVKLSVLDVMRTKTRGSNNVNINATVTDAVAVPEPVAIPDPVVVPVPVVVTEPVAVPDPVAVTTIVTDNTTSVETHSTSV